MGVRDKPHIRHMTKSVSESVEAHSSMGVRELRESGMGVRETGMGMRVCVGGASRSEGEGESRSESGAAAANAQTHDNFEADSDASLHALPSASAQGERERERERERESPTSPHLPELKVPVIPETLNSNAKLFLRDCLQVLLNLLASLPRKNLLLLVQKYTTPMPSCWYRIACRCSYRFAFVLLECKKYKF